MVTRVSARWGWDIDSGGALAEQDGVDDMFDPREQISSTIRRSPCDESVGSDKDRAFRPNPPRLGPGETRVEPVAVQVADAHSIDRNAHGLARSLCRLDPLLAKLTRDEQEAAVSDQ